MSILGNKEVQLRIQERRQVCKGEKKNSITGQFRF